METIAEPVEHVNTPEATAIFTPDELALIAVFEQMERDYREDREAQTAPF